MMAVDLRHYRIAEPTDGVFVYALTEEGHENTGEPAHWLCRKCVSNDKKSILSIFDDEWYCDTCNLFARVEREYCPEFVESDGRD